ncbi:MAG: hypothetical protein HKN25_07620 [Pyrinomonadaceae bacterium]|nr:hypothetical protein [Pyrinomonadaceae bacterium]
MSSKNLKLESYGVKISIDVAEVHQKQRVLDRLEDILPIEFKVLGSNAKTRHHFSIKPEKKKKFSLLKGDENVLSNTDEDQMLERLDSNIRLTVAEFAVDHVFVHSGVVEWKGKAIMIPASSYDGKTTMVAELVKKGATYYSDEYAILNEKGLVTPFPKTLSIREASNNGKQVEYPVETFGGKRGVKPLPIGMVLVTKYKKGSHWKPELLTRGEGVLEIISHTVPIRNNPEFSLTVLNKVVENALIVKSNRGEASRFVNTLIKFYEERVTNSGCS